MSAAKFSKQTPTPRHIGRSRVFLALEQSEFIMLTIEDDLRSEFFELLNEGVPLAGGIPIVFGSRRLAQIRKSVVGFIAINVVNFFDRPLPGYINPSEAMGHIPVTINLDTNISGSLTASSQVTTANVAPALSPTEDSDFAIKCKNGADTIRRKISSMFIRHETSP